MYKIMDQETAMKKALRTERAEGRKEGKEEGAIATLSGLVNDGILSVSDAAKRAGMSIAEFQSRTSGCLSP